MLYPSFLYRQKHSCTVHRLQGDMVKSIINLIEYLTTPSGDQEVTLGRDRPGVNELLQCRQSGASHSVHKYTDPDTDAM